MKVDAVVTIFTAVLAVTLILTAYSKYNSLQVEAYNCYGIAQYIAKHIARKLVEGESLNLASLKGWEVYIYYSNGTVCHYALNIILCEHVNNFKPQSKYRCYTYFLASDNSPQPVLVEVRG
ncbi:MAG: hypothetical protein QXY49_07370 [Thermofilaceae archaeon]